MKLVRRLTLLAVCLASSACTTSPQTTGMVKIVGVENFYAGIASQVGGRRVQVNAILSDPNVDPHVYESNVDDAKLVANANIVVKNGTGYDAFIDKLLAASPRPNRIVIDVGQLTGHKEGDNPHLWYDTFNTMPALILALVQALTHTDAADSAVYSAQGQAFLASLQPIKDLENTLQRKYPGAPVMATEPLWNYMAKASGLNMLYAEGPFQKATQDGNDPPAYTVIQYREAITGGAARLLMFNDQTQTPMSQQLVALARQNNIPVVPMSETEPPSTTYQQWMVNQQQAVLQALGG